MLFAGFDKAKRSEMKSYHYFTRLNFQYEVYYNHSRLHPSTQQISLTSYILEVLWITTQMTLVTVVKQPRKVSVTCK